MALYRYSSLIMLLIAIACASSPTDVLSPLATITLAPTQELTSTPTTASSLTSTPTARPTESPTSTPTPLPTPIGGGSGRLLYLRDLELTSTDLRSYDTSIILAKERLTKKLGLENAVYSIGYVSPIGRSLLIQACEDLLCNTQSVFLATTDLANVAVLDLNGVLIDVTWSPNGENVLLKIVPSSRSVRDGFIRYAVSAVTEEFGKQVELPKAWAAFWSADGQQVYYFSHRDGFHVIRNDGTNDQLWDCELCPTKYYPSEGAASPNGEDVIVEFPTSYNDGVKNSKLILTTPGLSGGHIILTDTFNDNDPRSRRITWSPDGTKLLSISESYYAETLTEVSEIVVVNAKNGAASVFPAPRDVREVIPCDWSPDSQTILYVGQFYSAAEKTFSSYAYVQNSITGEAVRFSLGSSEWGTETCPIWQ